MDLPCVPEELHEKQAKVNEGILAVERMKEAEA
jgi:hypothetical protein